MRTFLLVFAIVTLSLLRPGDCYADSVTLKTTYGTDYLGSFTGSVIYSSPVVQSSLTLEHRGLYLTAWGSYSASGGWSSDYGDELDLIIGYTQTFADRKLTIDVGYMYEDLVGIGNSSGNLHGLYCSLTRTSGKFQPFVSLLYEHPTDKDVLPGALLYRFGVKRTIRVKGQPVNAKLTIFGHAEAYGLSHEPISAATVSLASDVKLSRFTTLTPQLTFVKRLDRENSNGGLTQDAVVFSLTLTRTFNY